MSDPALDARLVELETRLAFQERALAELGDALAAMRMEHARQGDLLRHALEELRAGRSALYADPASEPPPPHY